MEEFNQHPHSASQQRSPKLRINRNILKLAAGMSLILIACFGYAVYDNNQKQAEYEKRIQSLVEIKNTSNVQDVVQRYGTTKGDNKRDLENSNSEDWNKAKLDKVYFNLLYADKVGSFNEVYAMLFFVDVAEKSGLDIDDNSYGVNQQIRSDIKSRADAKAGLVNSKPKEIND